jgi:predicted DNA-binding protein
MAKAAAFSLSEKDYKRLQEVAKSQNKTVSSFIKGIVWPHVEKFAYDLEHADEIRDKIRHEYRMGGVTKDDLRVLYNKSKDEIATILAGV